MDKALILVVEDDLALLEGIRELLEISGYDVLTAANGREAIEKLDQARPDLIVSDIMMPEMDGYAFHAEVRKRQDLIAVPFIFLTARGEKMDIRRGKSVGADDYITKPFDDEDLLVAIESKLSRWAGLRRYREEEISDLKHRILLTLSHEFRTPLTYIINYADMLNMGDPSVTEDDFREFMDGIRRGARRLNKLVEDFLILVELETGEAVEAYLYRRQPIDDTSAWLRVVARRFQSRADARGLELKLDIPDGLPTLIADEAYLADALGRLIDNAIKFSTDTSQRVSIQARAEGDRLRVAVIDEGRGIRADRLEELFDVFEQVDREYHEQQGTGSGLAICRGIVEIHGGEVGAESQEGKGSTFWILLPLRPPDMAGLPPVESS